MKSHPQSFTDGQAQLPITQHHVAIKSITQTKKNSHCGPTRVQARRQGKVGEAGFFREEKLIKRNLVAKDIKPQEKKQTIEVKKVEIDPNDPYALIRIENTQEKDIVCDVCLEEEDYDEDEILICELCQAATHQSCYGGEIKNRLPESDQPWYCTRCVHLIENKNMLCTEIKCSMCP